MHPTSNKLSHLSHVIPKARCCSIESTGSRRCCGRLGSNRGSRGSSGRSAVGQAERTRAPAASGPGRTHWRCCSGAGPRGRSSTDCVYDDHGARSGRHVRSRDRHRPAHRTSDLKPTRHFRDSADSMLTECRWDHAQQALRSARRSQRAASPHCAHTHHHKIDGIRVRLVASKGTSVQGTSARCRAQ